MIYLPPELIIIIASYLQQSVKTTKIVIKQYLRKDKPTQFHILLKNGSSKIVFQKYIDKIKNEIILNSQRTLKEDFSHWDGLDKNSKIDKLFRGNTSPNIYHDTNFTPTDTYLDKYIIHDIGCALFCKFVKEISEPYEIYSKFFIRTKHTSECCYNIHIKDYLKHHILKNGKVIDIWAGGDSSILSRRINSVYLLLRN